MDAVSVHVPLALLILDHFRQLTFMHSILHPLLLYSYVNRLSSVQVCFQKIDETEEFQKFINATRRIVKPVEIKFVSLIQERKDAWNILNYCKKLILF